MQRGVGEHGVQRLADREIGGIADTEIERREIGARLGDHLGRGVDAQRDRARPGDGGGQLAGSAAEIEDSLARVRGENIEQRLAVLKNVSVALLVILRVPAHYGFLAQRKPTSGAESVSAMGFPWLMAASERSVLNDPPRISGAPASSTISQALP